MPSIVQQHPGHEGAQHVLRAMREVDDVEQAEDDGQAEAQQRVERAVDQPEQELAEQRLRGTPRISNMRLRSRQWAGRAACRRGIRRCGSASSTSGQLALGRAGGRPRSAGMVAQQLVVVPRRPSTPAGFFTSNRYMSWILRPSARIVPLPNSGSSVGISFILAITGCGVLALRRLDRLQVVHHARRRRRPGPWSASCRRPARRSAWTKARVSSFWSQ